MEVEVINESIVYTVAVKLDEDSRAVIQWGLGFPDNTPDGRDSISKWISATLNAALKNIRQAKLAPKKEIGC